MTRPAWGNNNKFFKCKGCQERTIGCHATCKNYIEEKEARQEELQRISQINDKEDMMIKIEVRKRYRTVNHRKRGKRT